ncbi:MAG: lipooligosaccharide transport system permease protein [Actinomycetota bacterium]|jgi:lipooligosaccharide transport system permease protein|nr:lipooligosaccharide transport system permease protein [Actinomycetota bacterium]
MSWRALHVAERNVISYRRNWKILMTGLVEPFLYLLSIGVGVGALVGKVPVSGRDVSYESFVAPALLATSAMNGAIFDATFNFFFKIKYAHTFDAMLATPLGVGDVAVGEMGWSLARSTIYAAAFLLTMAALGLVDSWWAVLALPAATLIGMACAGVGMAATTYMRSFVHFDYVNLALIPLFLFSATFFPISRYPEALQWVVRATPLYQGVALERGLVLGDVSWALLGHALYLVVMGAIALRIAARRLGRMLLP